MQLVKWDGRSRGVNVATYRPLVDPISSDGWYQWQNGWVTLICTLSNRFRLRGVDMQWWNYTVVDAGGDLIRIPE